MATSTHTINSIELARFIRFMTVGALGTFLDFSLLLMLKSFGASTLIANSLSFSAGVVNNFTWNRLWTFADARRAKWGWQLAQFVLVSLAGLGMNNIIVLFLESPMGETLGNPEYGYLPAKFIATVVVVFWNYFANRFWTFRDLSTALHRSTQLRKNG